MGLTGNEKVVALAGNPNVGKSTVFNALTGARQHTGNWPGKTVSTARGSFSTEAGDYILVDIPGTYSLMARSPEEEVARDFLCFGSPDAVVVVCDATCLERNLNLVLQILETGTRAVVCVNLMDEARRKGIHLDLPKLSRHLGVPVVGVTARHKSTLRALKSALDDVCAAPPPERPPIPYPVPLEGAIALLEPQVRGNCGELDSRWVCLKLLENEPTLLSQLDGCLGPEFRRGEALCRSLAAARNYLAREGIASREDLEDLTVSALMDAAHGICRETVVRTGPQYDALDGKLDRLLTSRATGYPVMLLLLALVFYLTIAWANYPSELLSAGLLRVQNWLTALFLKWGAPAWLHGLLVLGVFRVLSWVVSVMLPPMAIFFPLFTLLEDAGYLPRVAYNLDKPFQKCSACGKQALCMCMGFGCNAAGIVGCRIIDSPRERLLAILTNNFVPCNGRFPALITIVTLFFVGTAGALSQVRAALILTGIILLGVGITFAVTKLLSATLLKGVSSSFTLEMPPYRPPQVGKVIVRSIFDRTLFVLGRAAAVAAPAGALIWVMANVHIGDLSLLAHCARFLDPLGRLMGLDGAILTAFLLGFPANEIVIPILVMAYLGQGSLTAAMGLAETRALLTANGWTWVTAVCAVLFFLNHWPCSTTLLTIRKETGSWKWTAIAAAVPTLVGFTLCTLFANFARLFLL